MTKPELQYVGRIPGSIAVEWQTWPGSKPNPEFLGELADFVDKEQPVMFLCRSGARSHAAAEAAAREGWKSAYNVLEGFEGDKDADGHRNTVGLSAVAALNSNSAALIIVKVLPLPWVCQTSPRRAAGWHDADK